ncbi:MAG: ABC transporter permease [Culicoidibacterales bacterium]
MKRWHLVVMLCLLAIISLFVGVGQLNIQGLFAGDAQQWQLLWLSRIPRMASIIIAGMSLSVAGLIMQQLTQNKFVEPTTAGTMEAAKFGVLVSMLVFTSASPMMKAGIAFIFAFIGTLVFMQILKHVKQKNSIFIPLVGIMFGNIISAITIFFAYRFDIVQNVNAFMQGDFSLVVSGQYELIYLSIPLLILAFIFANRFTVAGMGESFARNLGANYQKITNGGLLLVSILSAVVLLSAGTIPFLGLVVPNLVALYRGDHLRKSLWDIMLFGAIFVLVCDMIGRLVIYPYELPISLVVGVIGSGIFLYLILRRERQNGTQA